MTDLYGKRVTLKRGFRFKRCMDEKLNVGQLKYMCDNFYFIGTMRHKAIAKCKRYCYTLELITDIDAKEFDSVGALHSAAVKQVNKDFLLIGFHDSNKIDADIYANTEFWVRVVRTNMVHKYDEIIGKVLKNVKRLTGDRNDVIVFEFADGLTWTMQHYQDCCEGVSVDEIIGELDDLIGSPLTMAEEVSACKHDIEVGSADLPHDEQLRSFLNISSSLNTGDESYTWTFYKFATTKGYVTIRWYGSSNGYYSESVDFGPGRGY